MTGSQVNTVLESPEQVIPVGEGRDIYQSRVDFDDGRTYLLRVIVDTLSDPAVVVTAYRTSKVAKYWRTS